MKNKVSKDMKIAEVVEKFPVAAKVLIEEGLGCIGCVASEFETMEEGLRAHGMDVDKVIAKINELIANNDNAKS